MDPSYSRMTSVQLVTFTMTLFPHKDMNIHRSQVLEQIYFCVCMHVCVPTCVHACMCVHVPTCAHVCRHTLSCMCAWLWRPDDNLWCDSSGTIHFVSWELSWQTRSPQNYPASDSTVLGLQTQCHGWFLFLKHGLREQSQVLLMLAREGSILSSDLSLTWTYF